MIELEGSTVHIKDKSRVTRLLESLVYGGSDKLQVVADFDFTLTCFTHKGEKCVSCHKALDDSSRLPDVYRKQAHSLRNHYYPMEIDPKLNNEEKFPLMVEWWTKSHNLLINHKLRKQDIRDIVQESKLILRDGSSLMFDCLHQHQVPLLIFSAGLGDIIKEAILHQSHLYDNMKIVSNFMKFNNKGVLTGFQEEMIHSLNKNESAVHAMDNSYFEKLRGRENIILLGDNIGDLKMVQGVPHIKNLLKIGFLNDKVEERLEAYMDAYDIVLVSDETMDVANAIISRIFRDGC